MDTSLGNNQMKTTNTDKNIEIYNDIIHHLSHDLINHLRLKVDNAREVLDLDTSEYMPLLLTIAIKFFTIIIASAAQSFIKKEADKEEFIEEVIKDVRKIIDFMLTKGN